MKLYFYKLNTGGKSGKTGITVQVCEAEEKPKTYRSVDRVFPTCLSTVRKDEEGQILGFGHLFLTEPNFEYAKDKFKKHAESRIAQTKEILEREEKELKIIEESEE
jgi:hypothetical protein|nr:MAG TPA: hypothetical protein [Bacteriophage sp.]DAZ48631.1 MAG TPA: hypothetical protein [Caudoviricetes sp.]